MTKNKKTKQSATEIIFILDESGSMGGLRNDTIGGFNTFVDEQKKLDGEANITLVKFNTAAATVYSRTPLTKVPALTEKDYCPSGGTALFDAIGMAIYSITKEMDGKQIPENTKVVFAITTDGEENSSVVYNLPQIKKMIEEKKEKLKWEFLFFGANIDSFAVGGGMGLTANRTMNFVASKEGMESMYRTMSCSVAEYRTTGNIKDVNDDK